MRCEQQLQQMEGEPERYKGARKDDGKIIKGTITEAPLKVKVASIPHKNENIIYRNHHAAAFGNSQERFYVPNNQKMETTPGPTNYNPIATIPRIQSKKGLGSFASQTKLSRFFSQKRNWNPGPGNYEVSVSKKKGSRSSVYLSSQIQARQLFKNQIKVSMDIPGPCDYEYMKPRSMTNPNTTFNSKNTRFGEKNNDNPPVGWYNWENMKSKVKALKFGGPTTKIKPENQSIFSRHIDQLIGEVHDTKLDLGPGKYNPTLLQTKKTFSIKQTKKDRFGSSKEPLADTNIQPHKQQRQQVNNFRNTYNSVFKSKSKRYEVGQQEKRIIGDPCHYSPTKQFKQSHLINFANKWV